MAGPISPHPVTQWQPDYLPAYLSNGLVGVRVGHIPLLYGVAMVSSFEGLDPETGVEAFARVPYPLAGDVRIGRAALSDPGRAMLREQRYDFSCGELLTKVGFEADDVRADLDIVTWCSRTQPSLVLQAVSLVVDRDCEVTMSAIVDARDVPGQWGADPPGGLANRRPRWAYGPFSWHSLGGLSQCGIVPGADVVDADRVQRTCDRTPDRLTIGFTFAARRGQRYRMQQGASMVPQAMHSQPHMEAGRLIEGAAVRGFDNLRQDNRVVWDRLWQGRVLLEGAPTRWQAMADAAFFYLHTSVHASSPSSTSVFGLAYWPNYHYYRGHMMWDIEAFAVPTLLLTQPQAALGLLRYRGFRLPAALANARLNGLQGAQYPWESSLSTGHEATPMGTLGPATEQHVSMDVAIAFARYAHATGDLNFARYEVAAVMGAVAAWIESRVEKTPRGYEIPDAIGIAETGTTVSNSAFMNMAAATTLREAISLAKQVDLPYEECWEAIADGLVIPTDERTRVIQNHDGYHPDEDQGATPEAAAGLFPLEFPTDPDTERATLQFYVDIADRYAGQPMLSALLGVHAARTGDRARALDLFEKGYGDFVVDPYNITLEYSPTVFPDHTRAGPFTANLAGFLTSCLYGLTGLRLHAGDPTSWFERPIVLPEGWDAVHVDRIWAHRQPKALHAHHGDDRAHLSDIEATR